MRCDLIAARARETPSAIAVVDVDDDGETLHFCTFSQLDARVDELSRAVRSTTPATRRVGSLARGGLDAVVALFAAGRANRSIVALDADAWPSERVRRVASDARVGAVICTNAADGDLVREVFGETVTMRVIMMGDDAVQGESDGGDDDVLRRVEDDEAYVAFTSGTNGVPKGTAARFGTVLRYAEAKRDVEKITSDSRVCLASNVTFDLYPGDAYCAALAGAAMVVASRAMIQRDFARVLVLGRATHVCCTPTVFSLADFPRGKLDAPDLRCVSLAGEKMSARTLRAFASTDDDEIFSLYNVYGATETTVVQTYARMRADDDPSRVGRAYDGFATVYIVERRSDGSIKFLDDASSTITSGERPTGEIAIGGPCVSDGYLNDRELTAKSFIDDASVGRVYLTGDRGCFDASGDLYLRGRSDRQVKIRGHRIELDEIERALRASEKLVQNAVVFFDADAQTVTAHCQVKSAEYLTADDEALYAFALERHATSRLPSHGTPHRYVFIARDRWPLTSSGKTDRRLLMKWLEDGSTRVFRPEYVEPERGLESVVADAWARALGLLGGGKDVVGALDAFDALGGNSLSVLAVSRALAHTLDPGGTSLEDNGEIGLRDGEAAALLRTMGDEPAACSFGVVEGPFAPCEILARPVLRDYANYLRECGVTIVQDEENHARNQSFSSSSDATDRCMMTACSRGVFPVVFTLANLDVPIRGEYLRVAAASLARDALSVVQCLIAHGADVSQPSEAGTLPTHVAAARGHSSILAALLAAGAPPGAKDGDKQTILHLAVRSEDTETIRVAANACKDLKTRAGGLEAWDRWKRTAASWALHSGSLEALQILRDAGAKLNNLESAVSSSSAWRHGELSARSRVQFNHRPERKKIASLAALEALSAKLDETRADDEERRQAASAIRELVCANAENRARSRDFGVIPKLCARARERQCLDSIGAVRNLAANTENAVEAGECGAMEILADIIRIKAKSTAAVSDLVGEDKRLVFAAASAMTALAMKHGENVLRAQAQSDIFAFVRDVCDGMDILSDMN